MRVTAERLALEMRRALAVRNLPPEHAEWVVSSLVNSSLRGIDTHGVRLFPTYLAELDGGRACLSPTMSWSEGTRALRRLDAGNALGIVAGMVGAREAVRLAGAYGVGAVSIANSNHFGAASSFAMEMAKEAGIGICCSNSDALVAPFQGTSPVFGTNPVSIAAFADDGELFCLDIATSQVSFSQVKAWLARAAPLPEGWAIRSGGEDAVGARSLEDVVALKALGGYKGHGLAMALSMLCVLLADMPFDHELSHLYQGPYDTGRCVSHLLLALDVDSIIPIATFRTRLRQYMQHVRRQPALPDMVVRVPGDLEATAYQERLQYGVPLSTSDIAAFEQWGIHFRA